MKYFLVFILICIHNQSFSQSLSYNDLKNIYINGVEKAEIILSKKGYEFFKREEAVGDYFPSTTWAYKRINYNNKAKSFLIKYCDNPSCGFAFYQLDDLKHFNSVREFCKKNGYRLTETKSDPFGGMDYVYENYIYRITFSTSVNKDGDNVYIIQFDNK